MKIPDANILIYAHHRQSPYHKKARAWLLSALTDESEQLALPAPVLLAFIRIITNPRLFVHPLSLNGAASAIDSWFEAGAFLLETPRGVFQDISVLIDEAHGGPNLVLDAYIAALALHHRATVYSNDRDFQRFKGLRLKNPIDS